MDYAIEVLTKSLESIDWALDKWSDQQTKEFSERRKMVEGRKKSLQNAINNLSNNYSNWIYVDVYQDVLKANPCFVKTDKGNIYLLDYYTSNSSICETQSVVQYLPITIPNP